MQYLPFDHYLLESNGEDLKDLIEKLEPQQRFIESEIEELSKPEFSKLKNLQVSLSHSGNIFCSSTSLSSAMANVGAGT
jgi:phosphopantetheinyl transferase